LKGSDAAILAYSKRGGRSMSGVAQGFYVRSQGSLAIYQEDIRKTTKNLHEFIKWADAVAKDTAKKQGSKFFPAFCIATFLDMSGLVLIKEIFNEIERFESPDCRLKDKDGVRYYLNFLRSCIPFIPEYLKILVLEEKDIFEEDPILAQQIENDRLLLEIWDEQFRDAHLV
jgi:hypothetical protein